MSARRAESYWLAITPIQAEEAILAARIASQPYAEREDQRKWLESLNRDRRAFSEDAPVTSMKDFVEALRGRTSGKDQTR